MGVLVNQPTRSGGCLRRFLLPLVSGLKSLARNLPHSRKLVPIEGPGWRHL